MLSEETYRQLESMANEQKLSISEYLREIIAKHIIKGRHIAK